MRCWSVTILSRLRSEPLPVTVWRARTPVRYASRALISTLPKVYIRPTGQHFSFDRSSGPHLHQSQKEGFEVSADEEQIRDVIQRWLKASARGDLDAVLSLMTNDVVFLTPSAEPLRGQEAFASL